jgi:hypothetical protein
VAGQRDITLDVTIRARTADADKAAAALKRVDEQAAHAGKSMEGMTGDANILNAEIKKSEQTVKDLDKVLLEFGNDRSVRQRLRSERSWLAELRKLEKDMASGAGTISNDLGAQLSSAFSGLPAKPMLIAGLIGAVAAAAPTIGAMLGGAIAGAAGTGAMAAGILSAIKDPQVQDAASRFGQDISAEFFGGGEAFVEPVIKSLGILQKAFGDLHLSDQLAKVAPDVEVIAQGFADAGREFMEGFGPALDRMGPLADIAGKGIADFGEALGEALDNITASKGTVEGLETLLSLLSGTIRGLGVGLGWLGDRFHDFNVIEAKVFGDLEDVYQKTGLSKFAAGAARLNDVFERMTGTGENLHGVLHRLGSQALDPFAGYLHDAAEEMDRLHNETESTRKSLVDYFNTLQGQLDANIAWEQAIDDLTDSFAKNGTSLDITTQKGRDNTRAVEAGLEAARRQYETGQLTNEQYDAQIKKLIDIGVKAGASRKALEELAKQYEIQVVVNILAPLLPAIGSKLASMFQNMWGSSPPAATSTNRRESFAAGGVTPAFAPFRVHDNEMLWSSREHYVSTAAQTNALMSGASGGSASPVVITFAATGDPLLDAILRELKSYIRVNGGTGSDSVQTALGY